MAQKTFPRLKERLLLVALWKYKNVVAKNREKKIVEVGSEPNLMGLVKKPTDRHLLTASKTRCSRLLKGALEELLWSVEKLSP